MRRMLDPTKVGGIPSTIEFDKDGNRNVTKNLGIGGKLTLKSLVSASNPDGDITKELGGGGTGNLYRHLITLSALTGLFYINYYGPQSDKLTYMQFNNILNKGSIACSGITKGDNPKIGLLASGSSSGRISITCIQIDTGDNWSINIDDTYIFSDNVIPVD